jgi:pyruvate/2-oxoglutarate dehydrogenase complex dihydrolipoamide dehydrogenase (E3) component
VPDFGVIGLGAEQPVPAATGLARAGRAVALEEHRAADYRAIPRCAYTTRSTCCVGVMPSDQAETTRAAVEDDDRGGSSCMRT